VGDEAERERAAASRPSSGDFVGREHELERLDAALTDAFGGRGRLVVLSGEQGIGKTRIATEVAARAGRAGARVCWGRCYEREGAPPYWPWVQVIRACAEWCDPELVRRELPRQAAIVAGLVPELGDRLTGLLPAPSPTDPKEARFGLFDATAAFLTHVARDTPLVVVLDDLHAADAESLLLLEILARELTGSHLLVIGTYRDVGIGRRHPLAATLAELTRDGLFERLALRGLSDLEVSRFIEASVGDTDSASLARVVHEKAEGNPLFMTEVVRLLVQERRDHDVATTGGWGIRVPESIREAIGRRLDGLSPETSDLLRLAAVIGREFEVRQLRPLVDEPSAEPMLSALDEAAMAHIVEAAPDRPGRYRFTHGLVQETIVDELTTTQRVRLHSRVLEALESLDAADIKAHAAELVRHAAEAEAVLGLEPLVRYARIAGDDALSAHSYDAAHAYFRQALDAKGRVLDDDAAWLHFGLARCEFATRERYDLDEALEHMRVAFTHFIATGDEQSAVAVAVHPVPYVYGSPEAADVAGLALDLVPPESPEAGHLLSTLGWFAGMRDYERSREAFERGRAIASTLGDRALERKLLVSEAHVDFWHLRYRDCMDKAASSIELAREAGDEHTELAALSEACRMSVALGDPAAAHAHTVRMLELADRFHERYWLVTARVNRLWLAVLTGDWEEAQSLSDEGLALQRRDARNLGLRAMVEATLGNDAGATDHLEQLLRARGLSARGFPFEDACAAAFVPIVERLIGRSERRVEEAARPVVETDGIVPFLRIYVDVGQGLDAVRRGDAALARMAYDELLPLAGTYPPLLGMSADRLLGVFARAAGARERALEHLDRGLEGCRAAGYSAEYAWTAWDAAATLSEIGGAANGARSVELRAEAIAVARGLGMSRPSDAAES
jgi:tetratricopeptide (TPR) repeat protein